MDKQLEDYLKYPIIKIFKILFYVSLNKRKGLVYLLIKKVGRSSMEPLKI